MHSQQLQFSYCLTQASRLSLFVMLLALALVLLQNERPVAYYSRKMTAAERNYVVTEQDLLATVEALRVFRCYLLSGQQFNLVTDNRPNTFLQTQPILSRRQARWSEYLQRFHFNWVHRPGRRNVADPLSRNPDFVALHASLAVMTRSAASKQPSSSSAAPPLGQKRNGGVPASGAVTVPPSKRRKLSSGVPRAVVGTPPSDPAESVVDGAPASSSAVDTDDVQDATFIDDVIEAYAADPFFADENNTAGMSLIEGLWWKESCIVVPNSADTKRLVLKAMHDHPLAGHLGVTKTTKAINNRFFWRNAHQEVRDYIRHYPSCQLQTSNPSKPTGFGCSTFCLAYCHH